MTNETMTVEQKKYTFELDDDAGMYPVIDSHKKQIMVVCDGEEHARHICKLLNDERASVQREADERWEKVIKNIVKKWKKDYIPYAQCCKWLNDMDNIIATAKEQDK